MLQGGYLRFDANEPKGLRINPIIIDIQVDSVKIWDEERYTQRFEIGLKVSLENSSQYIVDSVSMNLISTSDAVPERSLIRRSDQFYSLAPGARVEREYVLEFTEFRINRHPNYDVQACVEQVNGDFVVAGRPVCDWDGDRVLSAADLPRNGDVSVMPNPGTYQIKLQSDVAIQSVMIMDMLGREVLSTEIPDLSIFDLDVESLSPGLYTVIAMDAEGRGYLSRWMKL